MVSPRVSVYSRNRSTVPHWLRSDKQYIEIKKNPEDGQTDKDRQRDRETDRQRDRETERQTERQAERQRDRETERQRDRQAGRQTGRHRQTDRQAVYSRPVQTQSVPDTFKSDLRCFQEKHLLFNEEFYSLL